MFILSISRLRAKFELLTKPYKISLLYITQCLLVDN